MRAKNIQVWVIVNPNGSVAGPLANHRVFASEYAARSLADSINRPRWDCRVDEPQVHVERGVLTYGGRT